MHVSQINRCHYSNDESGCTEKKHAAAGGG